MRNVRRGEGTVFFLVNGGDRGSALKAIRLVFSVTAFSLLFCVLGLGFSSPVVSVGALIAGIPLLFYSLTVISSGKFARYRVTIDGKAGTVKVEDLGAGAVLWEERFDPSRLHLGRTRVQVGYISSLKDALYYGDPDHGTVEDAPPSPELSLLTIADRERLEDLARELMEFTGG